MNTTGMILGVITFLIIGMFHPIVIKAEYYFSKKCWFVFALAGGIFLLISLFAESDLVSCVTAVVSTSCFWSIHELFQQEERVRKGWFPKKPDRRY
ncbi:DUF4491 family protein [Ruminococcus sp.]|uniref:DUF4491 family protein n=1 Tax=Ruminococcus sp. TaxID=41978 RepID=UPI0025EDE7E6|nr:DUF4491 family protein [Ruminococcus sp.]MBQ8966485.1 DUF4491 family protein [Ruminococcus sp.]